MDKHSSRIIQDTRLSDQSQIGSALMIKKSKPWNCSFPLQKIRRIMNEESIIKTGDSFSGIAKESLHLMSKAVDIFIGDLTCRAREELIPGCITINISALKEGARQDEKFDFLFDTLEHLKLTIAQELEPDIDFDSIDSYSTGQF